MMPLQTKIATTYALLMVLVIATMSTTMASSPCSNFSGKERACVKRKDWCVWQGQDNTCVPAATEEECANTEKRITCRKLRCDWNQNEKKCLLVRGSLEVGKPEVDGLDTTPRPDIGDPSNTSDFLETMKEMDVETALEGIEKQYGDRYRVYVCPRVNPDVQCLMRNFDENRVKLTVNQNNVVKNATVG
jgi:hypothetical protein